MKITFLGTGTSHGVPRIACQCEVCTSPNPLNKRLRSSILVTVGAFNVLVDTTPDLRTQALTYRIDSVEAVLLTHSHADHIYGMDDVRCFCYRKGILPCYGSPETLDRIELLFDYAVKEELFIPGMPKLKLIPVTGPFQLSSLTVTPIPISHGRAIITAYRFDEPDGGSFVYASDCSGIPESSRPFFADLDLLVLDALRHKEHQTHFTVAQSVAMAQLLKPKQALFIHMDHDLDHDATNADLPPQMELAYDGLVVAV